MKRRLAAALVGASLLAAAAHAQAPLGVVVVDDRLMSDINVSGLILRTLDPATVNTRTVLQSDMDRKVRSPRHTFTLAIDYVDTDWRTVRSVHSGGKAVPADSPMREIVRCGENGDTHQCRYKETLTLSVPDAELRRDAATGITYMVGLRRGGEVRVVLTPDQIERQFMALNDLVPAGKRYTVRPELLQPVPMGLVFSDMTPADLMNNYGLDHGLFIQAVNEDSAGLTAGIKAEDILLAIDGKPVKAAADVTGLSLKSGQTLTASVWHNGQVVDETLKF
ncbi:PDZ domain-containing protein [Asticcacaulis solisilvae]|uniref:PDZ domain-containing protein n=1 Tax=Asticcacaulis solisilvae TaxID=1217274 RepID=UPI003FD8BC64